MNIIKAKIDEIKHIDDRLTEFNKKIMPFTQKPETIDLSYVAKDDAGNIIGGVEARLYAWKILFIYNLFVEESHRHKGIGRQLMRYVESEARAQGSTLAHLDTYDFQAKDFYLKIGYEVFGVLENCPPGHKRYYLKKNFK